MDFSSPLAPIPYPLGYCAGSDIASFSGHETIHAKDFHQRGSASRMNHCVALAENARHPSRNDKFKLHVITENTVGQDCTAEMRR